MTDFPEECNNIRFYKQHILGHVKKGAQIIHTMKYRPSHGYPEVETFLLLRPLMVWLYMFQCEFCTFLFWL